MKISFSVSKDNITEFSNIIGDNDIKNTIVGVDDDNNVIVEVNLSKEDRDILDQLEDLSENEED